MATDVVPARAARDPIVEALWFRSLARAALASLAAWTLSFAVDRYRAFALDAAANLRHDVSLWLSWVGLTVAAGLLFGLATGLPFTRVRFLPSRLLLAAGALLPVAHFWWAVITRHEVSGGWVDRFYWFDGAEIQFPMAAFAGVAIASGFVAERGRLGGDDAADAPSSRDPIVHALWFRFIVRAALALLSFGTLWFAADRFLAVFVGTEVGGTGALVGVTSLPYDGWAWLSWVGATVAAGLLFGLATWLPFAKVRFLPSRLLVAAAALLPVAHFWWVYLEGHAASGVGLERVYWFDTPSMLYVSAALAGVAIASGVRADPDRPMP